MEFPEETIGVLCYLPPHFETGDLQYMLEPQLEMFKYIEGSPCRRNCHMWAQGRSGFGKTVMLQMVCVRYGMENVFFAKYRPSIKSYDDSSLLGYNGEAIIIIDDVVPIILRNDSYRWEHAFVQFVKKLGNGSPMCLLFGNDRMNVTPCCKIIFTSTFDPPDDVEFMRRTFHVYFEKEKVTILHRADNPIYEKRIIKPLDGMFPYNVFMKAKRHFGERLRAIRSLRNLRDRGPATLEIVRTRGELHGDGWMVYVQIIDWGALLPARTLPPVPLFREPAEMPVPELLPPPTLPPGTPESSWMFCPICMIVLDGLGAVCQGCWRDMRGTFKRELIQDILQKPGWKYAPRGTRAPPSITPGRLVAQILPYIPNRLVTPGQSSGGSPGKSPGGPLGGSPQGPLGESPRELPQGISSGECSRGSPRRTPPGPPPPQDSQGDPPRYPPLGTRRSCVYGTSGAAQTTWCI